MMDFSPKLWDSAFFPGGRPVIGNGRRCFSLLCECQILLDRWVTIQKSNRLQYKVRRALTAESCSQDFEPYLVLPEEEDPEHEEQQEEKMEELTPSCVSPLDLLENTQTRL